MVGWHHRLNEHEFEQAPRDGEGSLACCLPWGGKESYTTEQLNNNIKINFLFTPLQKEHRIVVEFTDSDPDFLNPDPNSFLGVRSWMVYVNSPYHGFL